MGKLLITFLLVSGIVIHTNGQAVVAKIDNVVYIESDPQLRAQKQDLAVLCNQFIQKFYSAGEIPIILLDIDLSQNTSCYQLGYDNVYGTSINNDVYKPKTWDHTNLGIRIKVCDKKIDGQAVLKLLEYGIKHLEELKRNREKLMAVDFYDRADNISVNRKTIKRIINKKPSGQIDNVFSDFYKTSSHTASNY